MTISLEDENRHLKEQIDRYKRYIYKNSFDSLTGLLSREKFFSDARQMLIKNLNKNFVFIRFDIDRFQLVNSFFGLEEGDKLLKYFAYQIKHFGSFFETAVSGRINADVFAGCYEISESIDALITIIKRIISSLMAGYRSDYKLSFSFGIYHIENNTLPLETIYSRAMIASKVCKETFNCNYALYDKSMSEHVIKNQRITNEMHTAIANKEFKVYLQPKCDLNTGNIVGAEALVRWQHPVRGMISPTDFISVFEENGFISQLDEYILRTVCQYIYNWLDQGFPIVPISVNVSRVDLYNPDLPNIILSILNQYQIPIEYIHLEITESSYAKNPAQITKAIQKLKNRGFHIEMDDFGTGYSSLNMLSEMALDTLKLDMGFMQHRHAEFRTNIIIDYIVALANDLNLSVVAEGLETEEQLLFLQDVGCDIGQGYYFSKPLPKQAFDEFLKTHRSS